MAVLVRGATRCRLCGDVIGVSEPVVVFPPFVGNELDPIYLFNDGAFHKQCFCEHPLASDAARRLEEANARLGTASHCEICGRLISDPDDLVFIERLFDDATEPLRGFNNVLVHRGCLRHWHARGQALERAVMLRDSGMWRGRGLDLLILELEQAKGDD